jgi:hypothetical protein
MKSTRSTTVSVVRLETELPAPAFAELIQTPYSTLKSLESGRLKLSGKMALKIAHATGVSAEWLLHGDPTESPVTDSGEPWNREAFEKHEADRIKSRFHRRIRKRGGTERDAELLSRRLLASDVTSRLHLLLEGLVINDDRFALALAKCRRFVAGLERENGL